MATATREQQQSMFPCRVLQFDGSFKADQDELLSREWLVTNGLGGYASGTVAGVGTRRFHGLLIAALGASLGRTLLLAHLSEQIRLPDRTTLRLSGEEHTGRPLDLVGAEHIREFRLEAGLPVWRYQVGNVVLEKQLMMPHGQNSVFITYRLLEGDKLRLTLMPSLHFRPHEAALDFPLPHGSRLQVFGNRYEWNPGEERPLVRLQVNGNRPGFVCDEHEVSEVLFRIESSRGYDSVGKLWSPGYFRVDLSQDTPATLVASTESWETIESQTADQAFESELQRRRELLCHAPPSAQDGPGAELVLAADQFLIRPVSRAADEARMQATGDEARSVIAGYHWFTDWGRDTMISLEGLTLSTGRHQEGRNILRTFARYIRNGLIPNLFPEGGQEGLYHTADATLWFFHALDRYYRQTADWQTVEQLLPSLVDVVEHHLRGTSFGIGVDPEDGLLRQGAEGYQLTWMDAKVDGWVVTPRRGKAVEINALWYNALRVLEDFLKQSSQESQAEWAADHAERARASFNNRFWNESANCLLDIVDGEHGDDPACRPNQIFAVSLPNPVLDPSRWLPVVETVRDRLLTPVGLRSLAPGEKGYQCKYYGDLRTRDAAYHQGTVWAWLIGPFLDAWMKVYPDDKAGARQWLSGMVDHLSEAGIGTISEIFDAEEPYTPRGCMAQAWSVAETLRCWLKTSDDARDAPPDSS